jgi:tRNA A37 threonylcarbamoyladenosine dehydratase
MFSYDEFTTRNIGFVTAAEQQTLRAARVLVIGVGGMGGAAVQSLARTGIGSFAIADIDTFEVSNLNRQVFADLDTVDQHKAEATAARLKRINPEISLEVGGNDWMGHLDDWLARYPVVVNGMDDIGAGTAQPSSMHTLRRCLRSSSCAPKTRVPRNAWDIPRSAVTVRRSMRIPGPHASCARSSTCWCTRTPSGTST